MAFSLPSFHRRGSTKAFRKIGPSGRGCPLGVPLADASILINHVCLSENKRLLVDTSPEFRNICIFLKTGTFPCLAKNQVKHINFAMKKAAHLVHHAKFHYNINKTMRQEIDFFARSFFLTRTLGGKPQSLTSYLGHQPSHPLVIVVSRELEDTVSCLVSGGISLSPKRSYRGP